MNEKEFEARHGAILETLRAARGECPSADELLDWTEGVLEGEEAEAIERHVTLCNHCTEMAELAGRPDPQLDDLDWQRTSRRLGARRAPWSPGRPRLRAGWLAAAAAAIAAVALVLVFLPDESALPPSDIATTRSVEITLLEPRGPVRSVEAFHWQGIPAPVRYRVEVSTADGSSASAEPLWSAVTPETRLRADDALLAAIEAQQPLQWRVVVLDGEGYELDRSEWVAFELE